MGMTCATPGMARRRGRNTKSAYSRVAIALIFAVSTGMAISMISPMIELIGPMPACCTPSGSWSRTTARRSPTICRARYMSVPQSKLTQTKPRPTAETERTLSTPGRPLIAVSSGMVMSCSTSSGAMPPASTCSVTCGRSRLGNTSTGVRVIVMAPKIIIATASAITSSRLARLL